MRPGPIESAARQQVRDVRSRIYANRAGIHDAGVACPSASLKMPPRFVITAPEPEPVPEPVPEPTSPSQSRLCGGCRRRMKIDGSGIPPDQRALILQRIGAAEKHSVADCIIAVVVYLDISRELIVSPFRAKPLVRARQLAMWLSRNETSRSTPEIGRRLGGRDHTTIMHGCKAIDKIVATRSEPAIADAALALRDLFRQQNQMEGS